jgi:hypothetical protein
MLTYQEQQIKRAPRKKEARRTSRAANAAEFARTMLGIELDEVQEEVLRSRSKRGILNCTRQWGKSTVAAAKALHRATGVPGSLVLVASPCQRQSAEWMRKAKEMARRMGIRPQGDGVNPVSLALPNGSRIVGLPGTEATVRGFSAVSMLLIDEASRVTDETYKALRPMLALGGGDLWLMSTPCGKRGFFYEIWEHGGAEWMRVRMPATECPRIPKEFLKEERLAMGDAWFRQEYLCEFADSAGGVFDREVIEAALDKELEPLDV